MKVKTINHTKPHWSFWLICILMLIWNVMGCMNFIAQLIPESLQTYRASEQLIIQSRPLWATIIFAVAVFSGAIGCLFLPLRKAFSYSLLIISLLAVVITVIQSLSIGIAQFSSNELIDIVLMPIVIAGFLVWYARYSKNKNWIA